ncbi:efflux transporter periplasmic adaptor subunit [Nostocales cyanobacterium HT-58-2]|nr:efflux transporter periplasmic adaptor subunit [Nostocales cyanobacterium HT-58-2]
MRYLFHKLETKPAFRERKNVWHRYQAGGLGLISLVGLLYLFYAHTASKPKPGKSDAKNQRAVPVVVATVTRKTVPLEVRQTGTVEAFSTVTIKSQIGGQLTGVYFKEGQDVKKGQLLFKIDSRPQQAALMQAVANQEKSIAQVKQALANQAKAITQVSQAKANLTKDQAQERNAQAQAQRYSSLFSEGAVSRSQLDEYTTTADAQKATVVADNEAIANAVAAVDAAKADVNNAKAAVNAAKAEVDNAKIQLSYSSIYSPIDGRTGSLKINQGNLVKENDTNPLVSISQIRPIYVNFPIPQRLLPELNKYRAQGKLEVDALIPEDEGHPERGELTFVDSGVDTTTGTVLLKGKFANTGKRLSPGQFVNVVLKLVEEPNAIVVPTPAVQTGQKGQFVYVVNADNTVEMRPVVVGNTIGNESVIKQGLKPGEQVVTDGQFNLRPKAKVRVKPGIDSQKGGESR